MQTVIENFPTPAVTILWHNRLFPVPEFFHRFARDRKLAAIISSSRAGAWLSGLFEQLGIKPIRGSRRRRGVQAFREMLAANRSGYDMGITPDGSRGPIYEMKEGAAALALRTRTPIALLSFNFTLTWRLKSWDKFYVPVPFSRVDVEIDTIENLDQLSGGDIKKAAKILKERLDAITKDEDDYLDNRDESVTIV